MSEWIVLKFGGTSVSRRERWDTIGALMRRRAAEEGANVLVVVSALAGVTNALQAICDGHADPADTMRRIDALVHRPQIRPAQAIRRGLPHKAPPFGQERTPGSGVHKG